MALLQTTELLQSNSPRKCVGGGGGGGVELVTKCHILREIWHCENPENKWEWFTVKYYQCCKFIYNLTKFLINKEHFYKKIELIKQSHFMIKFHHTLPRHVDLVQCNHSDFTNIKYFSDNDKLCGRHWRFYSLYVSPLITFNMTWNLVLFELQSTGCTGDVHIRWCKDTDMTSSLSVCIYILYFWSIYLFFLLLQ